MIDKQTKDHPMYFYFSFVEEKKKKKKIVFFDKDLIILINFLHYLIVKKKTIHFKLLSVQEPNQSVNIFFLLLSDFVVR